METAAFYTLFLSPVLLYKYYDINRNKSILIKLIPSVIIALLDVLSFWYAVSLRDWSSFGIMYYFIIPLAIAFIVSIIMAFVIRPKKDKNGNSD